MRDYTKLNAWRKSHQLALDVYSITAGLPSTENYGLVTQMRRAAVSIPSNIAEGAGRRTQADYRKFIDIATGSTSELEYHIRLVRDLGYVPHADTQRAERTAGEIKKMLRALSNKLAPNTYLPTANGQEPMAKGQWPTASIGSGFARIKRCTSPPVPVSAVARCCSPDPWRRRTSAKRTPRN